MNVADLLQLVEGGRKTGMLRFDRGTLIKKVYFQNGVIVGSDSNDPKEYLGQLLIHYGKLNEEQLKAALQVQRKPEAGWVKFWFRLECCPRKRFSKSCVYELSISFTIFFSGRMLTSNFTTTSSLRPTSFA